jgi:Fe-S-cluster containining protein
MDYPCSSCGLCCQHVGDIPQLQELSGKEGACIHLSESNECSIYNERPLLCRIDEAYNSGLFSEYTLKEFYKFNASVCNDLQEKNNTEIKYRVIIKD